MVHSFEDFIDRKDKVRNYDVQGSQDLIQILIMEGAVSGEIPLNLLKHVDYASNSDCDSMQTLPPSQLTIS